ncbi:hypothetical protein PS15p_211672 [Mucor circinelloides]
MRLANNGGSSSSQFSPPEDFAQCLLRVGEGSDQRQLQDNLTIDPHLNCEYAENYRQVADIAFGDISTTTSHTTFIDTTVLAATNALVDQINDLPALNYVSRASQQDEVLRHASS